MVRYIRRTTPFGVKKLWDEWNIRGAILFSLSLQTLLILVAPIRKSSRKKWVITLIWFAYLLADAVANFAVGLISNSQRNQSKNPDQPKPKESTDLLAFWAPFLLLHLGGPDTITAFALEDNELWLRHLLGLGFQAATVLYVFIQSLPNEDLWIPTALMFTAGIIKYVERTRALFLASLDKYRDTIPYAGPNYAKLMEEYASMKYAKLPTRINMTPEPDNESKGFDFAHKEGELNHLEVVHYAYHYFQIFKGLVVDRIPNSLERYESWDFFNRRTAEDALRIIEIELNFLYGSLYTKVEVVRSIAGYIIRFIAFGSILSTLGLFYSQEKKDEFHGVDVRITYTLLLGAIALDVMAFLMLIFSDRTVASIKNPDRPRCWPMDAVFTRFLAFKQPRWCRCECKIKNSGSQQSNVQHHVLITPLAFRRWCGSVSAHNLIRYCLKSNSTTIHEFPSLLRINEVTKNVSDSICMTMFKRNTSVAEEGKYFKSIGSLGSIFSPIFRLITKPIKGLVDEIMYVSTEPFTKELWEFIFEELRNKSEFADDAKIAKRILSARGDWVLWDTETLLKYVSNVTYDESLLLWHIATDLCFYGTDDEKVKENNLNHRQFSKILSDYMLYLLVFQPTMMSSVAGIGEIRFRDTCAEAERFFMRRSLGPNEDKKACKEILSVNTDVEPMTLKGKRSKSVLFDATMLAKELNRLESEEEEDKWKLMSRVWVELVSYAASHCKASTHAQQVSKGGELITFFWLLMAHFGLAEYEGHARAKVIVGK